MNEYIERDATIRRIRELSTIIGFENPAVAIDSAIAVIERTPTADVVPVRHGEWIVCGVGDNVPWMCSHCGKTTASKYKIMYGKYCPNCGAKMDLNGECEQEVEC